MQTPDRIRRDLPADLDPGEREPLVGVAARLQARRPTPDPGFRNELRGALFGARAGRPRVERAPARPLALAASYVAAGALLLAIAAIGLAGAGPFAPD